MLASVCLQLLHRRHSFQPLRHRGSFQIQRLGSTVSWGADSGFGDQLSSFGSNRRQSVGLRSVRALDENGQCQSRSRARSGTNSSGKSSLSSISEDEVFELPISGITTPKRLSSSLQTALQFTEVFEKAILAVIDGNLAVLRELVHFRGLSLERDRDHRGLSLLHFACFNDQLEIVRYILSQGVHPFPHDDRGRSPLHICAVVDAYRCMEVILKSTSGRADQKSWDREIELVDWNGNSPIHLAARLHSDRCIKALLNCLPRTSRVLLARNGRSQTPLHVACSLANHRTVKEILEWKPSCIGEKHGDGRAKQTIQWIDANGDSPLIAIIRAHVGEDRQAEVVQCVRLIIRKCRPVLRMLDAEGNTPLIVATENGNLDVIRELDLDSACRTALHHAAVRGRLKVVDLLLSLGANPFQIDDCGAAPIHYAAGSGHSAIVKRFMNAKNYYEIRSNGTNYTVLMWAVVAGQLECVRAITMDSNRLDTIKDGKTSLHLAVQRGHLAIAIYLIEHGWNIEARDMDGTTPLMLAVTHGHVEIVELLLQKGANVSATDKWHRTVLLIAASSDQLLDSLHRLASNATARINGVDIYGRTPLFCAIDTQSYESARLLLQKGASPFIADSRFWTPLHVAASRSDSRAVSMLLAAGAPANAYSPMDDCTPLSLLIVGRQYVNDVAYEALELAGALMPNEIRHVAAARIQRWFRHRMKFRKFFAVFSLRPSRRRLTAADRSEKYPYIKPRFPAWLNISSSG